MRKVFSIFLTVALMLPAFLLPASASGEDTAPHSKLSVFQKKTLEYALLEYGMLQGRRKGDVLSPGLRSQFVFALERLVEVSCMPELTTALEYVGPATGKECLAYLSELEEYHKDNPVALCARHGIDSESCIDAYNDQYIHRYFPAPSREGIPDSQDFLVTLNSPSETDIKEHSSYYKARRAFKEDPSAKNRQALEKVLNTRIRDKCNPTRYRLTLSEPQGDWKANYKKDKAANDPLKELVDLYSNPDDRNRNAADTFRFKVPTNADKEARKKALGNDYAGLTAKKEQEDKIEYEKAWRLRLLPAGCGTVLDNAFSYDIQYPQAVCYREGFISPNCIRSLRVQRQRSQKLRAGKEKKEGAATGSSTEATGGFTSF